MHVLVVTTWFPDEKAPGAGIFNLRDAELLGHDHQVTVLHLGNDACDHMLPSGIRVVRIPFGWGRIESYAAVRRVVRRLLDENDLLHTMAFPSLVPLVGLRVAKPWVHTEHWTGLVERPTDVFARLGVRLLRRLLRRPDEVVAVGADLAEAIEAAGARSVSLVANHVRFSDRLPSPLEAGKPVRMIGVGGLVERKGARLAVEAVAELVRRGVDASLRWAGEGPERTDLEAQAARLGLSDRVEFVGHLDPDALSNLLTDSEVFVLPTSFETFGVAIAEALGHGLPVIVTGRGGHIVFLPPGGSRVVARTGRAIAEGVEEIIGDPNRWTNARIQSHARARFSFESRLSAYREVYRKALGDRGLIE